MQQVTQHITRHPFKIGQRLAGRYVVRSFLGNGSMGWVLKVSDDELNGEAVAIKVLYPHLSNDSKSLSRFHAEVLLSRQLSHPSIIHVHDLADGVDSGMFIAMEYIDGTSLAELLAKSSSGLPFDEALLILTRVGEGLLCAHEHGIVHRDLKPGNIMIGRDGSVKIGDFGLAKSFQQEFGLTRTGETLGTPLYMAPEQFEGGVIDQRTDIYAFGILAYELLTGTPPYRDGGFFDLARQHVEEPMPSLPESVPSWCREIVARCTSKAAADRPISLNEILPALQEALPALTKLRNITTPRRKYPRVFRRPPLRTLPVPAFLLLMIFFQGTYSYESYNQFCAAYFFALEYDLNLEVNWFRKLWGYKGSLLHPESAFDLVTPENAGHLRTLFTAQSKAASNGKKLVSMVHLRDAGGSTLLHRAVEQDSRELVEAFDETGVGFAALDAAKETPVTLAVKGHRINALRALTVNRRFEGEGENGDGDRPLHIAIRNRDELATQILLINSVNPDSRNRDGSTPMHLAVQAASEPLVEQLLVTGHADLSIRDTDGFTALMRLLTLDPAPQNLSTLARRMVEAVDNAEDLNVRDRSGKTALIHATQRNLPLLVAQLLDKGVRRDIRDDNGHDAADYAQENPELLKLLRINDGASTNAAS